MSFMYNKVSRAPHNPSERIEVKTNGTVKKYGTSNTSWPKYTAIQIQGTSHNQLSKTPYDYTNQNTNLNMYGNSMNDLFK